MAVTKTHPIKSTLKAAIDYILNPEKTDGKLLASSFGCGLETADIEFAWTREAAGDRGTHLGEPGSILLACLEGLAAQDDLLHADLVVEEYAVCDLACGDGAPAALDAQSAGGVERGCAQRVF